jgi:hypothetical protein
MSQVWEWIIGAIARLLEGLKLAAAGIVGRVLSTFGLSMVTFKSVLPSLKSFVLQFTSGIPAEAMNFLGAIGLGEAMSMVFSALTVRLAWKVFIVPTSVANQLPGSGQ